MTEFIWFLIRSQKLFFIHREVNLIIQLAFWEKKKAILEITPACLSGPFSLQRNSSLAFQC